MERLNKNFMWMAAANTAGSLFSVILFIYLARTLEVEAFGYLSYAMSFVFYLASFVELGLNTYGIREIAKGGFRAAEYVSNIISFRLLMAVFLFILFTIITFFTRQSGMMKVLMVEAGLMLFISALASEWAFQGLEKMHMVFVSFATVPLAQLALSRAFIRGPGDVARFPIINFIAALPVMIAFLIYLKFSPKLLNLDFKRIRLYLSSSLIIWSISLFVQLYNGVDVIILGLFRPAEEVGYYAVARRAVGGVTFLMIFLANAALPRLSFSFKNDPGQFNSATRKFLTVSVSIVLLVFLPLIFFSNQIISLTVGSPYLPAALPLRIMLLSVTFVLFNLPFSTGLIAAGLEKEVLKQAFASACLNIGSNFLLIKKYGMIGASVSFLLAEALALVWILYIYQKKMRKGVT